MILMAINVGLRKTITVDNENLERYYKLKAKGLLQIGKPEISFTEYANACMTITDLRLDQLLELRRRKNE
jgi:hypothetical protein